MNGAHLHLIVNELPIIAVFTSAVLLAIALVARSRDTWVRAGFLALAAAVVGAAAAFFTGDPAVDVIAGMPQTSNRALSQHHTRASIASLLVCVAALASVVVFARARKRGGRFGRRAIAIVLVAVLAAAVALAWTGLAGGRVNHPELQHRGDLADGPVQHH